MLRPTEADQTSTAEVRDRGQEQRFLMQKHLPIKAKTKREKQKTVGGAEEIEEEKKGQDRSCSPLNRSVEQYDVKQMAKRSRRPQQDDSSDSDDDSAKVTTYFSAKPIADDNYIHRRISREKQAKAIVGLKN